MLPVHVPTSDVNSEFGIVVRWHAPDRAEVRVDDPLVEIETSKALIEVPVPQTGVVLHLARERDQLHLTEPVALLFPDEAALEEYEAARRAEPAPAAPDEASPWASAKAVARAAALDVDLSTFPRDRLITVKDVERAATAAPGVAHGPLPEPRRPRAGVQRLLVLGGGRGAEVVLEMLATSATQEVIALVDDDRAKWGGHVAGVPVVGGLDRLTSLAASGAFDAAVIAIAAPAPVRAGLRAACRAAGLPLANVIDRTARIAGDVQLGEGNVIGAFCNVGTGTRVGDNNSFSAYNSFDHHNVLGSEIATGPGCTTSGVVTIGDGVVLGTGVHVEPHLTLGDGVQVASGAVVLTSVPARHAVKTRTFTTAVVPLRP